MSYLVLRLMQCGTFVVKRLIGRSCDPEFQVLWVAQDRGRPCYP